MKKLSRLLMSATLAMAVTGATMAAELPVEEYPGGNDDPTVPIPTLSADSAGRELPVEEYPGGNGGSGDPTDPDVQWAAKAGQGAREILQNFFAVVGR